MPLVSLKEVLDSAQKGKYAVGSFNVISLEFANAILKAAEQEKSPVILSIGEAHFPYIDIEQIAPVIIRLAAKSSVPVVLNLDHGESVGTAVKAIRCGFTSVMIDLSGRPYEENTAETALITRIAHEVGVSVEAELGMIGGGGEGNYTPSAATPEFFTDPDLACEFVRHTGVDALAVSVGNVHGFYHGEPKLDFDLISRLRRAVPVPLVLHGGSGISDDDFRRAISLGMCKVNFFTGMSQSAVLAVKESMKSSDRFLGFEELLSRAGAAVTEVVSGRMRVFGSSGKVTTGEPIN
ncbi:MAG: class II fructose-bisphosphate aldolase [Gemmatimonadota bacterium]|nr:class II fructose-bisphosphate aldolase [Gemmatimonadota bacterium]